jgi:hypothetical protein
MVTLAQNVAPVRSQIHDARDHALRMLVPPERRAKPASYHPHADLSTGTGRMGALGLSE